jgi:hypothetical protein
MQFVLPTPFAPYRRLVLRGAPVAPGIWRAPGADASAGASRRQLLFTRPRARAGAVRRAGVFMGRVASVPARLPGPDRLRRHRRAHPSLVRGAGTSPRSAADCGSMQPMRVARASACWSRPPRSSNRAWSCSPRRRRDTRDRRSAHVPCDARVGGAALLLRHRDAAVPRTAQISCAGAGQHARRWAAGGRTACRRREAANAAGVEAEACGIGLGAVARDGGCFTKPFRLGRLTQFLHGAELH